MCKRESVCVGRALIQSEKNCAEWSWYARVVCDYEFEEIALRMESAEHSGQTPQWRSRTFMSWTQIPIMPQTVFIVSD